MTNSDGGVIALRGLMVQTLVTLLESLRLTPGVGEPQPLWTKISLEPKLDTEKVDVLWVYPNNRAKAVQVKSTTRAFEAWEVKQWAQELLKWDSIPGIEYELCLVGQAANLNTAALHEIPLKDDGTRICRIHRKTLDIDAFRQQAASLVGLFMEKLVDRVVKQEKCLQLVRNIESQFNDLAIRRESIDRAALIEMIRQWFEWDQPRVLPTIRVFLSAAEDVVEAATTALDQAVHSFNTLESDKQGVKFERVDWNGISSDDPLRPGSTNAGLNSTSDLFLAVLSSRLGEPGGRRGTAHKAELERAIERWQATSPGAIAFVFDGSPKVALDQPELVSKLLEKAQLQQDLKTSAQHVRILQYDSSHSDSLRNQMADHLRTIARPFVPPSATAPAEALVVATAPPAIRSPAVEHYLKRLIGETGTLRLIGLGHRAKHLSIEQAFVPLRVLCDPRDDERPVGRLSDVDTNEKFPVFLDEVFRHAARSQRRAVVLLGDPGAGKTTAARQLAWSLAMGKRSGDKFGLAEGILPVLLRLRDFPTLMTDSDGQVDSDSLLSDFLQRATQCAEVTPNLRSPGPELLQAPHLLWIFDGLDEVFETAQRKRLARSLRSIVGARPQDWFLVTSRYHGYFEKDVPLGSEYLTFHVHMLGNDEMRRFVDQWFTAVAESELTPDTTALVADKRAKAEVLGGLLASKVYSADRLRQLARNPLMLTLLCLIYDDRQDLPHNRADLYAECIKVMLEHWRRQLGVTQKYDPEGATDVLAHLAWHLHAEQRKLDAPREELRKLAAGRLARRNTNDQQGTDGAAFLNLMLGEVGILAMAGGSDDRCGFLHRTFQESLAARFATKNGKAREMAAAAASAEDDWWHETVLVSLREEHYCPEFFRAMLKEGIAERQPDLADRCLNEAKYFFHEPFLEALNDPNTPPDRVAAVLRMLRGKADRIPELGEVVRQVVGQRFRGADEIGKQIRGYAQEILAHSGGTLPDEPTGPVRVDSRTGITWVAISPGEFLMGGDQGGNERPIHRVKITQGFWLAKYPVTNQQYGLFLDSLKGKVERPEYWDDRRFNQPEQPVVGVSWHDAQQYCEWAGCRLPTEAEWEYCCRATSQGEYCFGDDPRMLGEYAWFWDNSGGQTQPVGTKRANDWGLHDMHGNVWEWCQDWYSSNYYEESPMEDPKGPLQASGRVIRGGGWDRGAAFCRSAYRGRNEPRIRRSNLGFRVALSSEPVQVRSQPRKPRRGRRR